MNWRAIGAGLAAMSLASQAGAAHICATDAESNAIIATILPSMFDGLRERCAPQLPSDSVLMARGDAATARYRAAADAARTPAANALERVFAESEAALDGEHSGEAILAMFIATFETGPGADLVANLDARGCAKANAMFEAIEPLPAANIARLISEFMRIDADNAEPGEEPPFRIC